MKPMWSQTLVFLCYYHNGINNNKFVYCSGSLLYSIAHAFEKQKTKKISFKDKMFILFIRKSHLKKQLHFFISHTP